MRTEENGRDERERLKTKKRSKRREMAPGSNRERGKERKRKKGDESQVPFCSSDSCKKMNYLTKKHLLIFYTFRFV